MDKSTDAYLPICCRSPLAISSVAAFSDALVFLICVPNILGLYILSPLVKRELDSYMSRINSGEIKKFKNI